MLLIALWVLISLLCAPPSPCHQISNTSGIIRGGKPHNVLMRGRTHRGHKAAVLTASIILRKSWKKQQLSKLCAFAFFSSGILGRGDSHVRRYLFLWFMLKCCSFSCFSYVDYEYLMLHILEMKVRSCSLATSKRPQFWKAHHLLLAEPNGKVMHC